MNDSEIVNLYWKRSEQAVVETAKKYGKYCHTIAYNILENTEDSEECVNDTYLSAWRTIPPKKPSVLRTFLGRLTRNISIDLFRKKHADKRDSGNAYSLLDELSECVSGTDNVFDDLDAKEISGMISSFLGSIKETDRIIFVLRYWYGYPVDDISKKTGLSTNNVSVRLSRTRKALADHLRERGIIL